MADSSQLDKPTPTEVHPPWQVTVSCLVFLILVAATFAHHSAWWASGRGFDRDVNLILAPILLVATYRFLRKSQIAYFTLTLLSLVSFLASGSLATSAFVFGAELASLLRISTNKILLAAVISSVLLYCLLSKATLQFLQTKSTRPRRWQFSIGRLLSLLFLAAVFSAFFVNSNAWNQIHWDNYAFTENGRTVVLYTVGERNPFKGPGRVDFVWIYHGNRQPASLLVHQEPGFIGECIGNTVTRNTRTTITWNDIDEYKTSVASKQHKLGYDEFLAFLKNRRQGVSGSTE